MGTIISSGIGSGLDVAGLVSQLVAAEGRPQSVRLDKEEAKLQGKLSALGSLRSALAEFRSALDGLDAASSLQGRRVTTSSSDHISGLASSTAVTGRYEIEVERLATAQRLVSAPVADAAALIGTGTLTLSLGANAFSVTIDADNGSLSGIRDAINGAPANTGVRATIVNGVDGARLILSAEITGAANTIVVTQSGGDGGLAALVYDPDNSLTSLLELQAAQDARILIDGFAAESPGNTFATAIEGLEITLLRANEPGASTSLSVDFDRDAARAAVSKLVSGYNALVDIVAKSTKYDAASRTGGPLLGDAGLQNLLVRLRREWAAPGAGPASPFGGLADIGLTIQLDGKLALDGARFDAALDGHPEAVRMLFADATSGLGARLDGALDPYLTAGGILDNRTGGLNSSLELIQDRREVLGQRLASLEQRLLRQFNALDSLLSELQGTSRFLQQQLDNLPGAVFKPRNK